MRKRLTPSLLMTVKRRVRPTRSRSAWSSIRQPSRSNGSAMSLRTSAGSVRSSSSAPGSGMGSAGSTFCRVATIPS